jgi:hypothetical protein
MSGVCSVCFHRLSGRKAVCGLAEPHLRTSRMTTLRATMWPTRKLLSMLHDAVRFKAQVQTQLHHIRAQ